MAEAETRVAGNFTFHVTIPVTINVMGVKGDYDAARAQAREMLDMRLKSGSGQFPGMTNTVKKELVYEHCWEEKGR